MINETPMGYEQQLNQSLQKELNIDENLQQFSQTDKFESSLLSPKSQKVVYNNNEDEQTSKNELKIDTQSNKNKNLEESLIVNSKYGDQKIDISDLKDNLHTLQDGYIHGDYDPTRPGDLNLQGTAGNEALPSYSNRVNLGEFAVGNYREYQLRDELAHLIERYNKKFNGDAKRPNIQKVMVGEIDKVGVSTGSATRYQDKMIINPIAVPDPHAAEGNFSWMYLITPYYNQLVKDFNQRQMENHVLKQHFEYFVQMQEEKELLNQEFDLLQKSERMLMDKVNNQVNENQILEDKVRHFERNLTQVQPDRIAEINDKLDNLNNILQAKDGVIDQLLNEITLIKNEKDDLQNELLFKKQRIENLNLEFNTKELEYQRLWEDSQNLKAEVRGETNDAKQCKRENEMLNREIAELRDEINENQQIFDNNQERITQGKSLIQDYENRLRYANEVIMSLETESQQIQLDVAQAKATVDGQIRAYNELRSNYQMISQSSDPGRLSLNNSQAMNTIPKIISASNYYRPSSIATKNIINLMPSASKALSQQVAPSSIKSYLSVKKATIDLTSDLSARRIQGKDQKVRFSIENSQGSSQVQGGLQNLPASVQESTKNYNYQRRSDSVDLRIEKRNNRGQEFAQETFQNRHNQRTNSNAHQIQGQQERVASVNRNFVDTMSGLLGMSDDHQKMINLRASQSSNVFPLKRVDQDSAGNSPRKHNYNNQSSFQSPDKDYRNMETDISADNIRQTFNDSSMMGGRASMNSNMWIQTPMKNKVTRGGAPGNRNSQPQQISSVKQKQHPMSTRNSQNKAEEEKYRQSTWNERMSQLPKYSAYKSSIAFGSEGVTVKETPVRGNDFQYRDQQEERQPFQFARDYDLDIDALNEDDPQAKMQILKFKQQKIFDLQDQRKLLQSQINHIPDHSKQISQRQKKQELESELQKLTKRISQLKYDIKKMSSKANDD